MLKRPIDLLALALVVASYGCSSGDDGGDESVGGNDPGSDVELDLGNDAENSYGMSGDGGTVPLTNEQVSATLSAACAGTAFEPENIPGALQLVVDVSLSMEYLAPEGVTKWEVTHAALQNAIDALPPSLAVGIQTYPNREGSFTEPNPGCVSDAGLVPPAPLGEAGSPQRVALANHLNAVQLTLGTPTHDAYEYAATNGLAQYTGGGDLYMLLITDGAPTQLRGCGILSSAHDDPVDTRPIIDTISQAYQQGVRTFIIGSPGSEGGFAGEPGLDMREWLSEAAIVGGTSTPGCTIEGPNFCHFDMSQAPDFSVALAQGLGAISAQVASSCVFELPPAPAGETIDPSLTNVVVQRGDGSNELVLVDTQGDCSEGWAWSSTGEIVLCEATCAAVEADPAASVTVVFGCTQDELIPEVT